MRLAHLSVALAATLASSVVVVPTTAFAEQHDTGLLSRATGADGAGGDSGSIRPSASADGRFVAFESTAKNLSPDATTGTQEVYVRDTQSQTTILASRATGPTGTKANDAANTATISGDGRFVVFHSTATNLDPADTDANFDVFVRDLVTDTTTLVSRASGATGAKGNDVSANPSISGDGRFVAFVSGASNLDPDDTDDLANAYVRDLVANTTKLVDRADGPAGAKGNGGVLGVPVLSADGRFLAFESASSNLHPDDTTLGSSGEQDIIVRDLQTSTNFLASRATGETGVKGNNASITPAISADGRYVAFRSSATNLGPDPLLSLGQIWVRDLVANTTTLASRASGADGDSEDHSTGSRPAISGDGRYVAFDTSATNLSPDDADDVTDIYLRDTQAATTSLVSRTTGVGGSKANDDSGFPAISADGRFVAFDSRANNLSSADGNGTGFDIFTRDELGGPIVSPPPPPGPPPPPPPSPPVETTPAASPPTAGPAAVTASPVAPLVPPSEPAPITPPSTGVTETTVTLGGTELSLATPKGCVTPPKRITARVTARNKHGISKKRFDFVRRVKILRANFYLDGRRRVTDKRAAFKAKLGSVGLTPGRHTLTVRVRLRPLKAHGRQHLVGKRFRAARLTALVSVCG